MLGLMEIFSPYLLFINGFIVIVLNIILIMRGASNIWTIIILNVIIAILMNVIGLGEYDLLTKIVTELVSIIINVLSAIWDIINPANWFNIFTKLQLNK